MKKYITEYDLTKIKNWVRFKPRFSIQAYLEHHGYYDERPILRTGLTQLIILILLPFLVYLSVWCLLLLPFLFIGWGQVVIHLPYRTGVEDSEGGSWGLNYHDDMLWIYTGASKTSDGASWITFRMPWKFVSYRTSLLLKNDSWVHDYSKDSKKKQFYLEMWEHVRWQETYDYRDPYDFKMVKATVHVKKRESRMLGISWLPFFAKVYSTIEIDFDQEVGKGKGTHKGGVLGTGFTMLTGEHPKDALKRMEKTRKF